MATVAKTKATRKLCEFCKHWYLYPCGSEEAALRCANYQFLQEKTAQSKKKAKGKKK